MIQRQVSRLIILTAIIIGAVVVATLPNPNRLPNEASGSAYAAEALLHRAHGGGAARSGLGSIISDQAHAGKSGHRPRVQMDGGAGLDTSGISSVC